MQKSDISRFKINSYILSQKQVNNDCQSQIVQLVGIHQGIEFHSTWLGCSAVSAPQDAIEDTPDARWTPVPEVGATCNTRIHNK